MSEEKQIDIIRDLLTEFDEMGFIPTTTVPDPDAYAIKWRAEITKALEEYRKQSEGEWIYHECVASYDGAISGYSCSCCSAFIHEEIYEDTSFPNKFCPNCGAKMKGGAE